uniref:Uncharacterized protein n=1 Tax=Arundo donax TaxID=35708 RepID=A0A0A9AQW7_ARUDO
MHANKKINLTPSNSSIVIQI